MFNGGSAGESALEEERAHLEKKLVKMQQEAHALR